MIGARVITVTVLLCLAVFNSRQANASPVVFWVSEPVSPGDVVMAYGGDLQGVHSVKISRLPDLSADEAPNGMKYHTAIVASAPVLQGSEHSIKFVLPKSFAPGVFAFGYGGETRRLIDAPQVDWCQTTKLFPGLKQNEAPPGASIQVIGRNFVPAGVPGKVRIVLGSARNRIFEAQVKQIDKYSIVATLPSSLPLGLYQISVHSGYGGPQAWSRGLTLTVKGATVWPASLFNVKAFGALGDNMHDDSAALRKTLDAARRNGGGTIYFPAGTYRLNGWFRLPHRVVLRGEARNLTWLKWPLSEPASTAEIIPSVVYTSGEFAIENLSFMVRNVRTIVRDLSWDAAAAGQAPPAQVKAELTTPENEHDIFIHNVDFQLLYYEGRPLHPEHTAQWKLNGYGWADGELIKILAIDGVRNVEVSDCRFIGGTQRILDSDNARLERNEFNNQWATLAWTDLGGEHIVFQNNNIIGASSWRGNRRPVRYVYCAFNHSTNLVGGEREALTFDVNRIMPRKAGSPGAVDQRRAVAWQGRVLSAGANAVALQFANLPGHAYRGLDLLVLDGRGAGQRRTITDNTEHRFTVVPGWDVVPDATSVVLAYQLYGDCVLYRNRAEDTSVLLQIWGFLCDVTLDGNEVERSQGMWGLSGWFTQWLNNRLDVAVTFHPGVGPGGDSRQALTPERGAPYGLLGFAIAGRLTELPISFPYVRAAVIRGNHLLYGHRIAMRLRFGHAMNGSRSSALMDVVVGRNAIEHSAAGIDVDADAAGVLIAGNRFAYVDQPLRLPPPQRCLSLQ